MDGVGFAGKINGGVNRPNDEAGMGGRRSRSTTEVGQNVIWGDQEFRVTHLANIIREGKVQAVQLLITIDAIGRSALKDVSVVVFIIWIGKLA